MDLNYYIKYMENRKEPMGNYSIENSKRLLYHLGSPQEKLKTIHVAGTNGKGSIVAYISNALSSRYKCGKFISPFIDNICESIQINDSYIGEEDFAAILSEVVEAVKLADSEGYYPTYFDIMTACAFLYFYKSGTDIAVIEVGMGGRLDSTNVMSAPLACVIASISSDHTAFLGSTLTEIAHEKAGIIKKNVPVFVYPQSKDAAEVVRKKSEELNAPLYVLDKDDIEIIVSDASNNEYNFLSYKQIRTSLLGRHQIYNSALAITVLEYLKSFFDIDDEDILHGIETAKNSARIELISDSPKIILDGCHNRESVDGLCDYLEALSRKRLILGFSVLADKETDYIIKRLTPLADTIVTTTIDNPRAMSLDKLTKDMKDCGASEVIPVASNRKAFDKTLELYNDGDVIVWCGSLYLMKTIRKYASDINKRN